MLAAVRLLEGNGTSREGMGVCVSRVVVWGKVGRVAGRQGRRRVNPCKR